MTTPDLGRHGYTYWTGYQPAVWLVRRRAA